MKVRYVNEQDKSDPMNGAVIADSGTLADVLEGRRKNAPFIAKLSGDNGYEFAIGLGSGVGFAQYSRLDGDPPYLVAVPARRRVTGRYIEFLMNNTPTAIPARHILGFEEVKRIALHFFETGERSESFSWESI